MSKVIEMYSRADADNNWRSKASRPKHPPVKTTWRKREQKRRIHHGGNKKHRVKRSGNKHPELYKTQPCDTFEEFGECKYGDMCQYAHGKHELRKAPETVQPAAYKTVRCKNYWSKDSICPYGSKCKFVHEEAIGFDANKVRQTKAHKNYKTKECETFSRIGSCPYGDKCAFIHKETKSTMDPSGDLLSFFITGKSPPCRRGVSQEFENDVFGINFASHVTEEQKEMLEYKKEEDVSGYVDLLATMESATCKDGLSLCVPAVERQTSWEIFEEQSKFGKWSQVSP